MKLQPRPPSHGLHRQLSSIRVRAPGQLHPLLPPHLLEEGKGWWLSIGFGAFSPGHCTGPSPGPVVCSPRPTLHGPVAMFSGVGPFRPRTFVRLFPGHWTGEGGGGGGGSEATKHVVYLKPASIFQLL